MPIYLTPRGEPSTVDCVHICEQHIHEELSIIYCNTPEDRRLLERAASQFPNSAEAAAAIDAARDATGCLKKGNGCVKEGCIGGMECAS
jgi:hypothetical protein